MPPSHQGETATHTLRCMYRVDTTLCMREICLQACMVVAGTTIREGSTLEESLGNNQVGVAVAGGVDRVAIEGYNYDSLGILPQKCYFRLPFSLPCVTSGGIHVPVAEGRGLGILNNSTNNEADLRSLAAKESEAPKRTRAHQRTQCEDMDVVVCRCDRSRRVAFLSEKRKPRLRRFHSSLYCT